METDKSPDLVPSAAAQTIKPVSVSSTEQIELDKVLEALAEIIEAEGGILTP